MIAALVAVLMIGQAAPPQPAPPGEETVDRLSDVMVTASPAQTVCVRGERTRGSRISRPSACLMRGEWRAAQIGREDNRIILLNSRFLGQYATDSYLADQAAASAAGARIRADLADDRD